MKKTYLPLLGVFLLPALRAALPAAPENPASASAAAAPAAPLVAAPAVVPATPVAITPQAELAQATPLNFARMFMGAAIVTVNPQGQAVAAPYDFTNQSPFSALLGEDRTVGAPLPAGPTRIVVDLGPLSAQSPIQSVCFFSFNAAGTVEVFYAPDVINPIGPGSPSWRSTNAQATFARAQGVRVEFAPVLTRLIMLSFQVTQPGDIGALGVFGTSEAGLAVVPAPEQPGVNGAPPATNPNQKMTEFDFGPSIYGTRVTHIAGTPQVGNVQTVLDGDSQTGVVLGEKEDEDNILIVDLGMTREINKFGMIFGTKGPGKLEVFMLNELPESLKEAAPAGEDAGATPPASTMTSAPAGNPPPAPSASAPAPQPPTAHLWRQADGRLRPLLLAASSGSLAETLVLLELAAIIGDVLKASLPASFFSDNKPNVVQDISTEQDRLSIKFEKLPCRYVMIRWVPNSPADKSIDVYELNLLGDVPEDAFVSKMPDPSIFKSAPAPTPPTPSTPLPLPDEGLNPDPPPIPPTPPPVSP